MDQQFSASAVTIGERVRRLRLALGLTQAELADRANIASGSISMIENGHLEADGNALHSLAEVLDCDPGYFSRDTAALVVDRPKLRAYADAPQRVVDQTQFDSVTAVEAFQAAGLRPLPLQLPVYAGDLVDEEDIDRIAADTRSAAGVGADEVIPNVIRAAERLGCVVLPLDGELGRHWGMSLTVGDVPVIRVTRPSNDPEFDVPGDRQRFTVAHEIGHLVLHAGTPQPTTPAEAARMERQANRFAAAFLVPGDAALEDLETQGGRVTLSTLAALKLKWGYAIKAFVFRFRELGVIDESQARSLYKQISARKWNKNEPHRPGTESAVWLSRALQERYAEDAVQHAASQAMLHDRYVARWTDWSRSGIAPGTAAVTAIGRNTSPIRTGDASGRVSRLPASR